MVNRRIFLIFAAVIVALAGIVIKPQGSTRPWNVQVAAAPDSDPIAAASFNFGRLHPIGRWLVLSYSEEGVGEWPEPSAVDCGLARWVSARTLFGIPIARGLVHCSGKQVIWT
jgi:hypothetical protein